MKTPTIPMSPDELPQQRIVGVVNLPPCPDGIEVHQFSPTSRKLPAKPSQTVDYLCQVEWAWSPREGRISEYYIHRGRSYWILWSQYYDDNWDVWNWSCIASVPRKGVTQHQASAHLLKSIWQKEHDSHDLDEYHWVNGEGSLPVADLAAVAREVWQ